jgi:hypothetical protein
MGSQRADGEDRPRGAGNAEGTLFSYFETKDAFLNQLFIRIKHEIGASEICFSASRSFLSRPIASCRNL